LSRKEKQHTITFQPLGTRVLATSSQTILDAARDAGLHIPSECGGTGTCGRCRVRVMGELPVTDADLKWLSKSEIDSGFRLACAHRADRNLQVWLPQSSEGLTVLTDVRRSLPPPHPDGGLNGQYGVAIDIGTTTVVAYLIDLSTGAQIASESELNPQSTYGADVMSRLTFTLQSPDGVDRLSTLIRGCINTLIQGLCDRAGLLSESITRISVVGNTAMHHLFLGLDINSLAVAPFAPSMTDSRVLPATDVDLVSAPNAQVYCAPNVAGFVGGDAVAFVLSQGLDMTSKSILGIDLGTNGEVILAHADEMLCCSTAAGPAFEGATLLHGSRAGPGAIEHIFMSGGADAVEVVTIGNAAPRSICGSAVIDLLHELLQAGMLSVTGRLTKSARTIEHERYRRCFVVVRVGEMGAEREVLLSQQDIRKVQLAKAAVRTGVEVLLREAGISIDDLEAVYLAGAFGTFLRPESALGIGLLPPVGIERVIPVGNAAGEGAKRALVSTSERQRMEQIAQRMRHIELARVPDLNDLFVANLNLSPR